MAPECQGAPATTHYEGDGENLRIKGINTKAEPPGGRADTNNSTDRGYLRQPPPGEYDISVEVRGISIGRVGGPSGMHTEKLQEWIIEATQEKDPDT